MSKLGDRSNRHDSFHRRAKQQGFAARSVFKLEEIDKKHRVVRPGARVLDLGCRPGSWLQYAQQKGATALVGIDRTALEVVIPGARNPEQARSNAAAAALPPLSADDLAAVGQVYDELIRPSVHDRW